MIRDGPRKGPPSRERFAASLALAAAFLAAGSAGAESPPGTPLPAPRSLAARLPEAVAEAQKTVERVRGVPFRGKVASAILPEKDLPAILDRKLVEDLPAPFERYAASLEALGLIDFEPELRKKLTRLYARQVAGFYDPDEKKFYVVPERSNEGATEVPGLGITGLNPMEDVLLTHELTHALQDQRLDLNKLMKSLKESTDALMALQCVLEGEATVVMTEALMSRLPPEARGLFGADGLSKMVAGLAAGESSIEGSEGVPDYFVKELVFPYVAGTAWIEKKRAAGGWAAVDAAYASLPATTAEILHPERATVPRARLSDLEVPGPKDLPAGARRLYADALGEWTLRVLLERAEVPDAKMLAAEWQDDRILFFEPKGKTPGPVGFVWRIRCISAAGARKLADALVSFYETEGASDATLVTTGDLVEVTRRKAAARPAREAAATFPSEASAPPAGK
jgi:hypothetical protein